MPVTQSAHALINAPRTLLHGANVNVVRRNATGTIVVELLEERPPYAQGDMVHMEPWEVQFLRSSAEIAANDVLKSEFLALRGELLNTQTELQWYKREYAVQRDALYFLLRALQGWFGQPERDRGSLPVLVASLLVDNRVEAAMAQQQVAVDLAGTRPA